MNVRVRVRVKVRVRVMVRVTSTTNAWSLWPQRRHALRSREGSNGRVSVRVLELGGLG